MTDSLPPLDHPSYKWIFVGGKGGVGKTTTSCSIASYLSTVGKKSDGTKIKVLLVSTDPASNLGDVFKQHFSSKPTLVKDFDNLYACEQDAKLETEYSDICGSMPGFDELKTLSTLFELLGKDEYDVVVFDTAPTGHTMRLLGLTSSSSQSFFSRFNRLVSSGAFSGLLGSDWSSIMSEFDRFSASVRDARQRLVDSTACTFVCVLTPEFLPLNETERLIDFLVDEKVESHFIVVNQIMNINDAKGCEFCMKRYTKQQKYLKDIHDLYDEDFVVVEVPNVPDEIKEREGVLKFAENLAPLFSKR